MAPVNNLLLDTLSFCLLTRCQQYYIPAGKIFELLYMTGVRREEATNFSLWEVEDASTIKLNALKGNNPRYFTEDEVPQWFFDSVQDAIDLYPDFTKFKVNYYVKLLQLQVMYTDDKMLLSNMYRHNYAKKLYYAGMSYEDIRVKMGENTLSVVQGYINNPIYSNSFLFLELPFTSTQANFFTTSANNYIRANNPCLFALNYADNTNPLFFELPINSNYNFPSHSFSSPFGNTISKQVTLYLQAPQNITEINFNTNQFEGTVSANFKQLINLQVLLFYTQKFTDISNLYTNSNTITQYVLYNFMLTTAPTANYVIPSQVFSNSISIFQVSQPTFFSNQPYTNIQNLTSVLSLTGIYLDGISFILTPLYFTNLTLLNVLALTNTTFIDDILPATLINCTALRGIYIRFSTLLDYTYISYFTLLNSLEVAYNNSLTTDWPSFFQYIPLLKNLFLQGSFLTVLRIDAFIDNFYPFITTYASMTVGNTQFRQMLLYLHVTNAVPTGTYQAPSGYIQGTNNGSPASPKEKIWVLVNQYAHTIYFNS